MNIWSRSFSFCNQLSDYDAVVPYEAAEHLPCSVFHRCSFGCYTFYLRVFGSPGGSSFSHVWDARSTRSPLSVSSSSNRSIYFIILFATPTLVPPHCVEVRLTHGRHVLCQSRLRRVLVFGFLAAYGRRLDPTHDVLLLCCCVPRQRASGHPLFPLCHPALPV